MSDMNELAEGLELSAVAMEWLKRRNQLNRDKAEIIASIDLYDEKLKGYLNGNPLATFNGQPAISFKGSMRRAFDLETAKKILSPSILESCYLSKATAPAWRIILGDL